MEVVSSITPPASAALWKSPCQKALDDGSQLKSVALFAPQSVKPQVIATWATAILKNKIADWYRSPVSKRMVQFTAEDGTLDDAIDALYNANGEYAQPVPAWQQPDNRTEQRQMMTVLERCVEHLPRQAGRNVFSWTNFLFCSSASHSARVFSTAASCAESTISSVIRKGACAPDQTRPCRACWRTGRHVDYQRADPHVHAAPGCASTGRQ